MPPAARRCALVALRWWHIPAVLELEHELFGDEAWTAELFWSELANRATRTTSSRIAPDESCCGYGGLAVTGADAYIQTIGVPPPAQRPRDRPAAA